MIIFADTSAVLKGPEIRESYKIMIKECIKAAVSAMGEFVAK